MTALEYIITFASSLVLGLILTPMAIGMAVRWRIAEKPNGRNGREEIAHIGGVAITGAIVFSLMIVFLFLLPRHPVNRVFLPVLIAAGFPIFLLGIIDDLRSLHYLYKLFFQVTVSVFVAVGGLGLLEHYGLSEMSMSPAVIASIVAAFWTLTITTSFNLIDGVDGLASGIAAISATAFAAAGILTGQLLVAAVSLIVLGTSLAFLRYNFPPARIFMGDSGSLFFGLMFALVSLLLLVPGKNVLMFSLGSIVILSVPLLDTGLAFIRRVSSGKAPFEADHMHIHHIILFRYGSTRKVDAVLWSLSAVFASLGLLTIMGHASALAAAAVLDAVVFVIFLRRMVTFDMSGEKVQRILSESGISPSGSAVRED